VFVLAEFFDLSTRKYFPCPVWGMAASLSKQMSAHKEVPPVTEARTGDGAYCNRRFSPLGKSIPLYI